MDTESLINALKNSRKGQNIRKLAADYRSINDSARALYFSILRTLQPDEDVGAIYDFLAGVRSYVGIDDAISILRELIAKEKGNPGYAAALVHYLSEVGELDLAEEIEAKCSPEADVPKQFVYSIIGLLLRIKKSERALDYVKAIRQREGAPFPSGPQIMHIFISHSADERLISDVIEMVLESTAKLSAMDKVRAAFLQMRILGASALLGALDENHKNYVLDSLQFLKDYPLETHRDIASKATASTSFQESETVARNIRTALETGQAYSFVRMGDGEGRYLADLSSYPQLSEEQKSLAMMVWFWNSRSLPDERFRTELKAAYDEADVVGINPPFRVEFEYRNSVPGYVGVVKGNELLLDNDGERRNGQNTTYNWTSTLLDDSGFFSELFKSQEIITMISPHPDMELILRRRGAGRVQSILIPSENHALVVQRSRADPHYPDVYNEVLSVLHETRPRLCLVAGGVFGKIYCNVVRRLGGVAIDVGSLADRWVGIHTR